MPQPPNLQKMLAEAQAMMAAQQEAQEALKEERVETSAGGGMVKVVASGDMRIQEIRLEPEAVDPDDVEMLQDLVLAAVNQALSQAEEIAAKKMEGASGAGGFDPASALESLGLGGGLGALGGGGAPGGLPGGMPPGGGNRAARRAKKK
ncbi:MAG: Nucleoid-associated protein YaaK [uncultured Solirubrobacteraceae bacterium]|uniref:Nucleoid-associated protein AVDCRST_MAG85-2983 n=1 Tax=uncultured Solirubrobacteraceae bacterium TaxID=1162706 RepID=A0A6J4TG79_9ACTN|nr:MAG: Nucleoid-associated protein YaaK [uncultured Solirubrobacteraceae bacterium]